MTERACLALALAFLATATLPELAALCVTVPAGLSGAGRWCALAAAAAALAGRLAEGRRTVRGGCPSTGNLVEGERRGDPGFTIRYHR